MSDDLEFKDETLDVQFDIKALDDSEEKGEFSGYGSIFGNKDLGNDVVVEDENETRGGKHLVTADEHNGIESHARMVFHQNRTKISKTQR